LIAVRLYFQQSGYTDRTDKGLCGRIAYSGRKAVITKSGGENERIIHLSHPVTGFFGGVSGAKMTCPSLFV